MNRTQKKAQKKANAAQMAAIYEMRALVHQVAREIYVRGVVQDRVGPGSLAEYAKGAIGAGIAFVDALNAFVPEPTSVVDTGPAPVEPGSEAEMEARG